MLNFKKIEISDAEKIGEITQNGEVISCEKNIISLIVWQKTYNNMYALKDDMLFLKSGKEQSQFFALPFCDDLKKGIDLIFQHTYPKKPYFWVQNDSKFSQFKQLLGDSYDITPERDAFDYIYKREDLANLSGKKYHSKRNHIAAFSKQFDWCFKEITEENKQEVLECADLWYKENADRFDEYLATEKKGIEIILNNMSLFKAKGGAVYVDGKMVAFTLGSPINPDIFDIHIEKALSDYATAYTVINREFAKTLSGYTYINREDDMGIEGLRKAKLSYKPEILLEKYSCIPIEYALIKLYNDAFHDGPFAKKLFSVCGDCVKTLRIDGETVALCLLLPCEVDGKKAHYIYGFTVKEEHRGKGYGKQLMEKILAENDGILILRPADSGLIDYYKKFGFKEICASNKKGEIAVLPTGSFKEIAEKDKKGEYTAMYYGDCDLCGTLYFPYSMA